MQLTINGEACTCAEGLTVAALLREREHDATAVVVEHNGQIQLRTARIDGIDFAVIGRKALIGRVQLDAPDSCRLQAVQLLQCIRCVRMYGAKGKKPLAVVCFDCKIVDAVLRPGRNRDVQ